MQLTFWARGAHGRVSCRRHPETATHATHPLGGTPQNSELHELHKLADRNIRPSEASWGHFKYATHLLGKGSPRDSELQAVPKDRNTRNSATHPLGGSPQNCELHELHELADRNIRQSEAFWGHFKYATHLLGKGGPRDSELHDHFPGARQPTNWGFGKGRATRTTRATHLLGGCGVDHPE